MISPCPWYGLQAQGRVDDGVLSEEFNGGTPPEQLS